MTLIDTVPGILSTSVKRRGQGPPVPEPAGSYLFLKERSAGALK